MSNSVVIVGAGPGGAAAAVALAQRGVRDVLLLDKDQFPRDKTCGSALSPNGVALLDRLGVGEEVRRRGYSIDAARIVTPGGRQMLLTSAESAIILLRKHFDNLLVERAQALGVTFRPGFTARELVREGGQVVGVRSREGEVVRGGCVVAADGAHSVFSVDPRPRRTISTLMGWWEGFPIEPHTLEMVFDKNLAPLYGWMFPEDGDRVNIGICMDGEDAGGAKTTRNVRDVFQRFLDDHYRERLRGARPVGRWKGHPISYTTWIDHTHGPGVLYLGEAARITHNATGEGIYQAMQSGIYAADAIAPFLQGERAWDEATRGYARACRRRFTASFAVGHAVRALVRTPLLDGIAALYNSPAVRGVVGTVVASALAGSKMTQKQPTVGAAPPPATAGEGRGAGHAAVRVASPEA
jgi:geranylgeranyl reductase family protein